MLLKRLQICMFSMLMSAGLAFAIDEAPVCPSEIKVVQKVVVSEGNWIEYDSRPRHLFTNVTFSEGEPSKLVILAPSQQIKKGRKQIDTWEFAPSDTGYWISCEYTGTSMVLSRKLPDRIKSCDVEYDAKFSTPVAQLVICKP